LGEAFADDPKGVSEWFADCEWLIELSATTILNLFISSIYWWRLSCLKERREVLLSEQGQRRDQLMTRTGTRTRTLIMASTVFAFLIGSTGFASASRPGAKKRLERRKKAAKEALSGTFRVGTRSITLDPQKVENGQVSGYYEELHVGRLGGFTLTGGTFVAGKGVKRS
jgi:hypothetical protein